MAAIAELTRLDAAIERGTRRLLELQRPDGIWVGELESNVTMTSQHLFWNHYLGLRTPDLDRRIANELLARIRDDGTWSIWFEGPPDLSTSIEAYVACRLAGVDPGPGALRYIQREGGIPKSRLFTKCFMALLGQWPWQRMVPIPPELVLLPPSAPFSIYNFACWARQTFVALAVAQSLRPVRPADLDLTAIGAIPGRTRPAGPPNAIRRRAVAAAERWIRERQEADGSWGGIQPPWVWGIIALAALGHGLDDPVLGKAVEGWRGFMVSDGERLRPEACQSPVWDTGLALLALRACGVADSHPQLVRAGEYLLSQEVRVKGDWAIRRPDLAPGGWAFEYENDNYPDVDHLYGTGAALPGLEACGVPHDHPSMRRAVAWLDSVQQESGGFGEDIRSYADPAWRGRASFTAASQTAWALTAYVAAGNAEDSSSRRAADYRCAAQRADGDWDEEHFTGTGFPLDFMIRYHLYRITFPLLALGRLRERLAG